MIYSAYFFIIHIFIHLAISAYVLIFFKKVSINVYNLYPICEVLVDLFLLLFLMFPPQGILLPCVLDFIFDYIHFTFPEKYLWGFFEA